MAKYKLRNVIKFVEYKPEPVREPRRWREGELLECGHIRPYYPPTSKSDAIRALFGARRRCYLCCDPDLGFDWAKVEDGKVYVRANKAPGDPQEWLETAMRDA